jgi:5-methylcytosine-specific restriction endonuclease McrA
MSGDKQKTMHAVEPSGLPAGRVAKQCHCGQWHSLPACHAARHHSCTAECAQRRRTAEAMRRARSCGECGGEFIPRPNQARNGGGRYCSTKCSLSAARRSDAFKECAPKRIASRRASYVPKPPEENPRWKGGPAAYRQRRRDSGAEAAQLREYRKANPHKTREWAQNRKYRKSGRLEYGTIPRLMEAQRGRCAYCGCDIRSAYHVDHVVPLSKGGTHEAHNVQLLCASCNLHKSARDPIAFAQMGGRLL